VGRGDREVRGGEGKGKGREGNWGRDGSWAVPPPHFFLVPPFVDE